MNPVIWDSTDASFECSGIHPGPYTSNSASPNQGYEKQDNEDNKADLGDDCGGARQAPESKPSGKQRHDEENNSPVKHDDGRLRGAVYDPCQQREKALLLECQVSLYPVTCCASVDAFGVNACGHRRAVAICNGLSIGRWHSARSLNARSPGDRGSVSQCTKPTRIIAEGTIFWEALVLTNPVPQSQRPSQTPWLCRQSRLCLRTGLLGRVGIPYKFQASPDGQGLDSGRKGCWFHVQQFGGTPPAEDFPSTLLQCSSNALPFLSFPIVARED